jgi:P3 major capsid protein
MNPTKTFLFATPSQQSQAQAGQQMTAAQAQAAAQASNQQARRLILQGGVVGGVFVPPAVDMWQPQPVVLPASPGPGTVINFIPRNVGLVKRLIFRFTATVTAGATTTQTLTKFGLQNLISNVAFWDLGNNQRINTGSWHLTAISSAKRRQVFGSAVTTDTPLGYGNNNNRTMFAPSTIAANGNSQIVFQLEIPFVKNDTDLRGAIYADVTQANMQVQVTLNPNMFVTSTADPSLAMYQSGGTDLASLSGVSVQVFQNYLDQLPRISQNGALIPILPQQDIGTAYMLTNSVSALPVVNQDNSAAFVNARTYESVTFYYDNNGTLNVNGSDLTYIQLQSANFTNIYNLDGGMISLMERNVLQDDFPAGMHYLDLRHRPIDTNQYGNMQLVIKPSSVGGSGAYFGYGWEAYGVIGLVNQGGSISSGG